MAEETLDYEIWREQYHPQRLRVLLIAESPPDPTGGPLRFFYAPQLTYDNLFRGVAQAIFGEGVDITDKQGVLEMIQEHGVWMIDAVPYPVNKLSVSAKRKAIRSALPGLIQQCQALAPELGVITCKTNIYDEAADPLRHAGMDVLNHRPLPFPLGNTRNQFIAGFRDALAGTDIILREVQP